MTTVDVSELPQRLQQLLIYRDHLSGDEKGESQVFLDRLFKAFGHEGYAEAGAKLEMRIKARDNKGTSFADLVWKPRVLIEMKKAGADLSKHYRQAFEYWVRAVPDRPRYVVLSNFDEFWIYDFDHQIDEPVDRLKLVDLPKRWEPLGFMLQEAREPEFANDLVAVTRDSAAQLARLFKLLVSRGIDREQAQRFVLQAVMAMFSEDIRLLPTHLFSRAVADARDADDPRSASYDLLFGLFFAMNTPGTTAGGRFAGTPYFNGGLYAKVEPFALEPDELEALTTACATDWSLVRPEIFGTLFEQSLDEDERHAYGAHFTSQADISKIVGPCLVEPWRERIAAAATLPEMRKLHVEMSALRILDPACGCGNFLYVAYRELRRLEHSLLDKIQERSRGNQGELPLVTPEQFYGLDIRPFAVEVARVTLMVAKKLATDEVGDSQQVLPLENLNENIVEADALLDEWPEAQIIVGNPPYLGRRRLIEERGAAYVQEVTARYPAIAGVADYVAYWFPLTHDRLPPGGRAGLVATNSIRQGDTRKCTLDYIVDHGGTLIEAVSTQPWSGDAVVHVSLVNWTKGKYDRPKVLWVDNGKTRLELPELTSALNPNTDLRKAVPLGINRRPQRCFQGQTSGAVPAYELDAAAAHVLSSSSPGDAAVIHPYVGGEQLLHSNPLETFVIDVPYSDADEAWKRAPAVMEHLEQHALPDRKEKAAREAENNRERLKANPNAKLDLSRAKHLDSWWTHWRRRGKLMAELESLDRYIAVTRTSTHARLRIFAFVDTSVRPGDSIVAFPFDDDYSLGVLQSQVHREWFIARCTTLKADPTYTTGTVWDTFPWPQSPTPANVIAVAQSAAALTEYRRESMADGTTLAQLYDVLRRPGKGRLRTLHEELDVAVARAYEIEPSTDLLAQLLSLNLSTADAERSGDPVSPPGPPFPGCRLTDWAIGR
jgi:hypothetical protein